ncbi:MAG TPA: TIGR02281 family clan AA aspartic protease [Ramlibacter sp.]|jgi:aspartyl protease family protein|uniref:retropepsin-like aspartic protease family protein n=1 Tax=Ramlibacter sp. TaxID=1917967 RepID=UPI002D5CFA82|nr:TIGR02281 family clan AA aspartic protease [Ramlibacter sp.]HZY19085.1 TIGR02281 family clan AA aspartic protease [Ramlibacter sp.]
MRYLVLACALLAGWTAACAQAVALQGMLGSKALLIVDGGPPRSVAPGETWKGVKVVSTRGDEAVLETEGRRFTLRVGEAPASVGGGAGPSSSGRIVLSAQSGGHFMTDGSINGRAAYFMVDTGASVVSLGVPDAERMGLDYKSGQPVQMSTANGVAMGWRIKLSSVRVGDVEVREVDAVVGQRAMPFVLLGNSFLNRFQMRRDNDQLVLERRY